MYAAIIPTDGFSSAVSTTAARFFELWSDHISVPWVAEEMTHWKVTTTLVTKIKGTDLTTEDGVVVHPDLTPCTSDLAVHPVRNFRQHMLHFPEEVLGREIVLGPSR